MKKNIIFNDNNLKFSNFREEVYYLEKKVNQISKRKLRKIDDLEFFYGKIYIKFLDEIKDKNKIKNNLIFIIDNKLYKDEYIFGFFQKNQKYIDLFKEIIKEV